MNRFNKCTTLAEVVGQAVGAGSTCWLPNTGDLEFDNAEATAIVDDACERIREFIYARDRGERSDQR